MDNTFPSPQTTLGILLGASSWPYTNLSSSLAFTKSAHKIRGYFLYSDHFGVRPENWLDLFDTPLSSPNEIDQVIGAFLQERILRMKQGGTPARDLLFYYIGHGMFAPGHDQAYHLAIRSTRETSLRSSAISMAALAETLKTNARHLRRFVILDCCFSAESYKYLQSAPDQAALQQTISAFEEESKGSGFPGKGTALLCSSGNKVASLLLPDESGTMFSEAFIRALTIGNTHQMEKTYLSLADLKMVIEEVLDDLTDANAPLPYIGDPDQSEGNISTQIFFFPNPPAIVARVNRTEEGRLRLAEQAHKAQQAEEELEDLAAGNAPPPEVHSPDQSEGDVASIPLVSNPPAMALQVNKSTSKEEERIDLVSEQERSQPGARTPPDVESTPKETLPVRSKYQQFRQDRLYADTLGVASTEFLLLGGVGTLVGVFTQAWFLAIGAVAVLFLLAYALGYRKALSLVPLNSIAVASGVLACLATLLLASAQYDQVQSSHLWLGIVRTLTIRHQIIAGACIGAFCSLPGFYAFSSSEETSYETYLFAGAVLFGIGGGFALWLIITLLGTIFDWGFGFGYGWLLNLLYGFLPTTAAGIGVIFLLYIWNKTRRA